jgi:hypothetical protein
MQTNEGATGNQQSCGEKLCLPPLFDNEILKESRHDRNMRKMIFKRYV